MRCARAAQFPTVAEYYSTSRAALCSSQSSIKVSFLPGLKSQKLGAGFLTPTNANFYTNAWRFTFMALCISIAWSWSTYSLLHNRILVLNNVWPFNRPPLWPSGQSSWLQIRRSWVRFPTLPDFLRNSGFGTGSTQPHDNCGATWMEK
jgi:hypothetical protein